LRELEGWRESTILKDGASQLLGRDNEPKGMARANYSHEQNEWRERLAARTKRDGASDWLRQQKGWRERVAARAKQQRNNIGIGRVRHSQTTSSTSSTDCARFGAGSLAEPIAVADDGGGADDWVNGGDGSATVVAGVPSVRTLEWLAVSLIVSLGGWLVRSPWPLPPPAVERSALTMLKTDFICGLGVVS
jgi:hypothetical protein